jgi:nicotinamidase-related amidase
VLIDHQPYQFTNLHSHEPTMIVNNVIALAKTAKVFDVPTILTVLEERRNAAPRGSRRRRSLSTNASLRAVVVVLAVSQKRSHLLQFLRFRSRASHSTLLPERATRSARRNCLDMPPLARAMSSIVTRPS